MNFIPSSENESRLIVSDNSETLRNPEILRIAGEVNARLGKGEKIFNFTVGDFNPLIFPVPEELKEEIINAYRENKTNYPPADGIPELKKSVSLFIREREFIEYDDSEILIAAGARPLIYSVYRTIIDPGDSVIFPVPSWNQEHYIHLTDAKPLAVFTKRENNFMPSANDIGKYIDEATVISLCSPQNPTGTMFTEETLQEICRLILEENQHRPSGKKSVYLLFDQMYWMLTFGNYTHCNPVSLFPEMKKYTIYIDGLSKSFAATGIRTGWAMGDKRIISKMKSILSHIGAWAPKPEQTAAAKYLIMKEAVDEYLASFRKKIYCRLQRFFEGFKKMKSEGLDVDAIPPQAAIYLTVRVNLSGKKTTGGRTLNSAKDTFDYLLSEAKTALIPFYAFGDSENSPWFRLSVGTSKEEEIDEALSSVKNALMKIS